MTMEDYVVKDAYALSRLILGKKPKFSGNIRMQINQLDPRENEHYERRLNSWLTACGCELGSAFVAVSLLAYSLYSLLRSFPLEWPLFRNGIVLLFSAALLGKTIGIIYARIRFRTSIRRLIQYLNKLPRNNQA